MSKTHTTKHDHGNGHHTETTTTEYESGASKSVTKDISDRNLLNDGSVRSVTYTDSDGNSRTERYK